MAASNKFATFLYRNNTPKIVVVLIYTLLEWALIALLLLDGLFSYSIAAFAEFFGLAPPCFLCSHALAGASASASSCRRILCDPHARELAGLGEGVVSCSCCSAVPERSLLDEKLLHKSPEILLLDEESGERLLLDEGSRGGKLLADDESEERLILDGNSEERWRLLDEESQEEFLIEGIIDGDSMRLVVVEDASMELLRPQLHLEAEERLVPVELVDSSTLLAAELLDSPTLVSKENESENILEGDGEGGDVEIDTSPFVVFGDGVDSQETQEFGEFQGTSPLVVVVVEDGVDSRKTREFGEIQLTSPLVVVEDRVDSRKTREFDEFQVTSPLVVVEDGGDGRKTREFGEIQVTSPLVVVEDGVDSRKTREFGEFQVTSPLVEDGVDGQKTREFGEFLVTSPLVVVEDGVDSQETREFGEFQGTSSPVVVEDGVDGHKTQEFGEFQAASEEENDKVMDVEGNYEISIGSEICDQDEPIDLPHHLNQPPPVFFQCSESQPPLAFVQCLESYEATTEKEAASELTMFETEPVNEYGETAEKRGVSDPRVFEAEPVDETLARVARRNLSVCPELVSEVEEERAPETPTSVDGFNAMHKRFREFGTESLDGSVASEIDGSELLTVDHLKAALKSERKALSALYSELEEERSASSVAANQTMAMITRLQEEKAAMQMEAFQYQRMMEEQSEYDQEALQLLNDLVMKREREKQELEEELEAYRKKVLAYETKERRGVASVTNGRSQTSSALSTGDESNDLSSESHDGEDCDYSQNESHQNTPVSDALSFATDHEAAKHLLTLDDSLADFEEERFSILEQLKTLEEKLLSLDDDDDDSSKIINGLGHHFPDENGHGVNGDYESCGDNVNGFVNDSDSNGKLHDKPRSAAAGGKSLLPLFDATVSVESEDGLSMNQDAMDGSPDSLSKATLHNHKKLAIAEEVDNIYERLQALEGDREFIKHCISSMRKGDKGMDLLQEILQHLRDLRSVQLRVRNAGYALASLSA